MNTAFIPRAVAPVQPVHRTTPGVGVAGSGDRSAAPALGGPSVRDVTAGQFELDPGKQIPSVMSTLLIRRCGDQPAPYEARERRHLPATPAAKTPPLTAYEVSGRRLRVSLIR
jgi:hypothetical protein